MSFEIDKVAELARIRLREEEKRKLQADLDAILRYVEKLRSVQTEGVEPTSHVLNVENVYRQDKVKAHEIRDEVLDHAPQREDNFFKVPKVVER
ncbi:MAG: Asp-tRNA(Asn)/Glu-tRNA(Gln) amidotransferase subunit GatC [Candidatus Omnitrophota bacterium]|nr:Asp-tRNA(Asn)/Glu-tRNA(Gln) amidotransferase subunit GatC [Candidatus Omnitrophota bacterium]